MPAGYPVLILTTQEFNDLLDMVYGKDKDIPQELLDRVNHFMDTRKYAQVKTVSVEEYYK